MMDGNFIGIFSILICHKKKGKQRITLNPFNYMVGPVGLEPTTNGL